MSDDCKAVIDHAEVLVIGLGTREFQPVIQKNVRQDQIVVDLVGMSRDRLSTAAYHGVCW